MSIKEALKLFRLETGMTQTDLANKLNKTYLTVNRWENGKGFPSRKNALEILSVAKISRVSDECYSYLYEVLMPESKRDTSAAVYGFPDVDKDFLFQLADNSSNSIYVIEANTFNLLYANRKAEKAAIKYLADSGFEVGDRRFISQNDKRCFNFFANKSEPCPFCPLRELSGDNFDEKMFTVPDTGRTLSIHIKKAKMNNRCVYVFYMTDITEKYAEQNALYELTNDIPFGVGIYNYYLVNNNIELVFMNTILFQMIGEERKESLLKNELSGFCLIHPEHKARVSKEIENSICEKRNIEIDFDMRIRDRKYHAVHLMARMIKKDREKLTYYCVFKEKVDSGEREGE